MAPQGSRCGTAHLSAARDAASGRLTGTTLGSLTSTQGYNALGELSALTWTHGATPLLATSYTRDALGRIGTKVEVVGTDTTTWSYHYDLTGRLTQVDRDGVAEQAYGYDANGNRTSLTNAGGTVTATYDAQDRLLTYGSNSYTYTANGELTAKIQGSDTTRYTYDVLGNLLAVDLPNGTGISYVVDAVGRRIGRKVGGVLEQGWLYQDGLNPIAELDAAGNVVSRFVYGTRANVPDYVVKGGATYRIVSDELGSVRRVVDVSTGAVAQELAYDAWGRVLVDTNPGWQPFGYAGGVYDAATGLVRFGARDYDAEVGRWTAKDPIGFYGAESNLYAYARQDPVSLTDSNGLAPCRAQTRAGEIIVDESIAGRAVEFINRAVEYGWNGRISESFRSSEYQEFLYRTLPKGRAASPGRSEHEAGFALDLSFNEVGVAARDALLRAARECGFQRNVPGEPWHFFSGGYGPYSDRFSAIEHNQKVLEEAGSPASLAVCR